MPLTELLLIFWINYYATVFNVDPAFCEAVARVECGPQGLRAGPLDRKAKYYGPFAIHKDFLKKWPIDDPQENIKRGVLALRGKDRHRVLRRFNKESSRAYEQAVFAKMRELKRKR